MNLDSYKVLKLSNGEMIVCELSAHDDKMYDIINPLRMDVVPIKSRRGGIGYSKSQKETHDLIKSLHESGLGYRRIAQHLNAKNITTLTGKEWKGNHVFAVLKRYREREERLSIKEEVFKPEISKFEVRWERNY